MHRLAVAGIDVLTTDRNGFNCLHLAVQRNYGHIVEMLLESNFPITAMTNEGLSVLHLAAKYGRERITTQLLTYLDRKDKQLKVRLINKICETDNCSALTLAIRNDFEEIAGLLLEHGAKIYFDKSPELKDVSPIFECVKKRKLDILELMEQERFSLAGRIKTANG